MQEPAGMATNGVPRAGDRAPDVVCLGETMAMVAPDPPRPLTAARTLALSQGGAESNVAIWLARLGCPAAWCSRLGDDALGRRVLAEVAAAGVDTSPVVLDASAPTGVYFKDPQPNATSVLYYRDRSAAARMDERDADRALAVPRRLLHLTGITPALSDSCAHAVDHAITRAAQLGVTVSFDVNYRPALWPNPDAAATALGRLARRCGVVFVGCDEAALLWGASSVSDIQAALGSPGTLVVKDGPRAARSTDDGSSVTTVAALPVEVVEPVGAGDAFAAGWLYGWLRGLPAAARLRLGHLIASSALGSATDHGELPLSPAALEELARTGRAWPELTSAGE
ncbi:MAG TPA: sugar kinase [Streptosporangiaceae bacterium]|jgi:2-dehydro-3-deoxygluconokinase